MAESSHAKVGIPFHFENGSTVEAQTSGSAIPSTYGMRIANKVVNGGEERYDHGGSGPGDLNLAYTAKKLADLPIVLSGNAQNIAVSNQKFFAPGGLPVLVSREGAEGFVLDSVPLGHTASSFSVAKDTSTGRIFFPNGSSGSAIHYTDDDGASWQSAGNLSRGELLFAAGNKILTFPHSTSPGVTAAKIWQGSDPWTEDSSVVFSGLSSAAYLANSFTDDTGHYLLFRASSGGACNIVKMASDGTVTHSPGGSMSSVYPAAIARKPDGTVLIADGTNTVFKTSMPIGEGSAPTWSNLGTKFSGKYILHLSYFAGKWLAFARESSQKIFLYKSVDDGSTWTQLSTTFPYSIAAPSIEGTRLYVFGLYGGIAYTDDGETWVGVSPAAQFFDGGNTIDGVFYVTTANIQSTTIGRAQKTINGTAFIPDSDPLHLNTTTCSYDFIIKTADGTALIAGGTIMKRSVDDGASWQDVALPGSSPYLASKIHEQPNGDLIAFTGSGNPYNGTSFYARKSTDKGLSWSAIGSALTGTSNTRKMIDSQQHLSDHILYFGHSSSVSIYQVSTGLSSSWASGLSGAGGIGITGLAFGLNFFLCQDNVGRIYKAESLGGAWSQLATLPNSGTQDITKFYQSSMIFDGTYFICAWKDSVYRSLDGVAWEVLYNDPVGTVDEFRWVHKHTNCLYAGGPGVLIRIT